MICLDTMVVIAAVQPGDVSSRVRQAQLYVQELSRQGERIILPAPVVAEYLVRFSPEDQVSQLRKISACFEIIAFDVVAAKIAAELGHPKIERGSTPSQAAKIDVQILATAIAAKADLVVTAEVKQFTAMARGRISVSDIPPVNLELEFREPI